MAPSQSHSPLIGGIPMGQSVEVRPASERYRDMYGGAIELDFTVEGHRFALHLEADGAHLLAAEIERCLRKSQQEYRLRRPE